MLQFCHISITYAACIYMISVCFRMLYCDHVCCICTLLSVCYKVRKLYLMIHIILSNQRCHETACATHKFVYIYSCSFFLYLKVTNVTDPKSKSSAWTATILKTSLSTSTVTQVRQDSSGIPVAEQGGGEMLMGSSSDEELEELTSRCQFLLTSLACFRISVWLGICLVFNALAARAFAWCTVFNISSIENPLSHSSP